MNFFPGGAGDNWLIVASAAGAPGNPAWQHNLAAHSDQVRAELAGRTVDVVAEQLTGAERGEAWRGIAAASRPTMRMTDRELPVIRLTSQ